MPQVFPFRPLSYSDSDALSALIAPPYDVLDAAGKARLLGKNPHNIVGIDLPHTPAKELGPAECYERAAAALRAFESDGTLRRAAAPAIFAYRQRFTGADGRTVERCGVCCTIDAVPFGPRPGGGVLPHEETFSGPKEDRMALMRATRTQLSPIFGLHADAHGTASNLVRTIMASRSPDRRADMGDGVTHESWTITDEPTLRAYQGALHNEDVFIADGHHRYTTQLNYLRHIEQHAGTPLPPDHPARRCMIVLISMSDPGLVIWPTHRVLGGMKHYSFDRFLTQSASHLITKAIPERAGLAALEKAVHSQEALGNPRVGLYDCATGRACVASPVRRDPLAARFPAKPESWRTLDVAWIQHVLVEEICQPLLNDGQPVRWAFPHTLAEVESIAGGRETGAGGGSGFAQLALIVRPTPLEAVREVSRAGELMPQKSTFFYPKLATGLWINPLE